MDDVEEAIDAVSRLGALHRGHIAAYARGRFSAERMVARNEQVYELLVARRHLVPDEALGAQTEHSVVALPSLTSQTRRPAVASARAVSGGAPAHPGRRAAPSVPPGRSPRSGPRQEPAVNVDKRRTGSGSAFVYVLTAPSPAQQGSMATV